MKEVLQFSGGIDSLACLFLLKDKWADLDVMWCNTGAAYPDVAEGISRLERELKLRMVLVTSDQPADLLKYGYPADIVPVDSTALGRIANGSKGPVFQNYLECCSRNIWVPMQRAVIEGRYNRVYRGQRAEERRKAPFSSGYVDEYGIEYVFPVEHWTREMVMEFCEQQCEQYIPESYKRGEKTGRDCWDCTAYLDDNEARIANLPEPQRGVVVQRLARLEEALRDGNRFIQRITS